MEWDEILSKIGARKSNWTLVKKELRDLSNKIKEGNLLTRQEIEKLKEIWKSKDPFIDEVGRPFVLYIYDRFSWWNSFSSQYKFHFKWCATLERMDREGRRARYKGKWDINNPLFESSKNAKEPLDVCKNCLRSFDFKGHYLDVDTFNMKEFFDTYGMQNLRQPTHQYYSHTYPKNWDKIAKNYKDSKDWVCEGCQESCVGRKIFLHTHHINGVKDDNSTNNLRALCVKCHSKQPMHSHMREVYNV